MLRCVALLMRAFEEVTFLFTSSTGFGLALRQVAFRRRAKELHPDVNPEVGTALHAPYMKALWAEQDFDIWASA